MRNRLLRSAFVAASGLVCAVALPSAASATYIDTGVSGGSANIAAIGSVNGNITYTKVGASSPTTEGAAIGEIALKGRLSTNSPSDASLTTIPVFCIDIYDTLASAQFTQRDISSITSPNSLGTSPATVTSYSQTQIDNVLKLLVYTTTGASPLMNNAITSAATQTAIWEILNETGTSWDAGAGAFKVSAYNGNTSDINTVIADANSWLGTVKNNPSSINTSGYTLSVWDPGASNQRQVQLVATGGSNAGSPPGAVPEPTTWATIMLGFGLLGGALRNRKRAHLLGA